MSITGATSLIISDALKNKLMHGYFWQGLEESAVIPALSDFVYEYADAMGVYSMLPAGGIRSAGGKAVALTAVEWLASISGFRGFSAMEDLKENVVTGAIDSFAVRPYVIPMLPGSPKMGAIGQNAYV
jgi:hypothetical protein